MRYKKLTVQTVFLTVLLATSILFFGTQRFTSATSGTVVYVDPPKVMNVMPPANFTIKVKLANVTNLYGLDVEFTWDPTIIKYVNHKMHIPVETYPDGVLHSPVIPIEDEVDESANMTGPEPGTRYWLSQASMGAPSFDGSGTIFDMTFKVVGLGTSPLQMLACYLVDQDGNEINVTLQQGTFVNYAIHVLPPAPANVTVNPSSVVNSSLAPGKSFTIDIDAQVDRLYAFTFWLGFNATILNATSVTGNPTFPPATIVKTKGQLKVSSSLVPPSPPFNGSLSLSSVKFNILAYGESVLNLHNITLSMSNGTALPINSIKGGYFSNMLITKMFVNPPSLIDPTKKPGNTFTIDIDIQDALGMYDYRFKLSYNKNVLLCLGAIVLPPNNDTNFDAEEVVNNTIGALSVKVQYYSPAAPIDIHGATAVVRITFMVKSYGQTALNMSNADISTPTGGSLNPVVTGGFFGSGLRDVAIMAVKVTAESYDGVASFTPSSPVKVYPGRIIYISVVPMNRGNTTTETFNVTLHCNSTVIGVKTVTLSPWTNTTLTFSWNTAGLIPGENFTLGAQANTVPSETNTANNVLYDGSVFIKMLGDVNGDRRIDILDVSAISLAYGSHPSQPKWNPEADIAPPYGFITIVDIVTCTAKYGVHY
jgi:hypothetical protein